MASGQRDHRRTTCLVTGATGFIGRNLVARLVQLDSIVRVLRRTPRETRSNPFPVVDIVADLSDRAALIDAMEGVDVVYHLAGVGSPSSPEEQYPEIIDTNVTGTLNVLLAAADAGVRRVVAASSASVYGRISSPALSEDMVSQPVSLYAISKQATESMCAMVHHSRGLETVALRYFSVYGPGEDPDGTSTRLIPSLHRRLATHQPIILFGDGKQTRDFVHVDDVVTATIQAGSARALGREVINVGSGHAVSVGDVVSILSKHMETSSEIRFEPERPYEIRHSVANIAKARNLLGFTPERSFSRAMELLASESMADAQQRQVG